MTDLEVMSQIETYTLDERSAETDSAYEVYKTACAALKDVGSIKDVLGLAAELTAGSLKREVDWHSNVTAVKVQRRLIVEEEPRPRNSRLKGLFSRDFDILAANDKLIDLVAQIRGQTKRR